MLVSATFIPHAPILLEEIGGKDSKKVQKTISALEETAENISDSDPETILIISPHSFTWENIFIIPINENATGSFFDFGHSEIQYSVKIDNSLAQKILTQAEKKDFPVNFFDNEKNDFDLDHGILVPLHFILKNTANFKILPLSFSFLNNKMHFDYGKLLHYVISKSKKRIAVISSGDLSHRLLDNNGKGMLFDKQIINSLENQDFQNILKMDYKLTEEAGECGYRSLLILLGILSKTDAKAEVLSYEGPFGVGYCITNFKIRQNA